MAAELERVLRASLTHELTRRLQETLKAEGAAEARALSDSEWEARVEAERQGAADLATQVSERATL